MSKRAAIYVRVSSEMQAERVSPHMQEEDCRAYCETKGYSIVEIYRDVERYRVGGRFVEPSGTRADRPQLRRMLKHATAGNIDVIVAWREDRLYRGIRPMIDVLDCIEHNGLDIELVKETFDRRIAPIKASIAKMELDGMRERHAMGRRGKALSGKWMGTRPPLGYTKIGKGRDAKLTINKVEAEIVKRIYAMYLGIGGDRPMTILNVAIKLTAEKVPISKRGRKSATGWTDGTVRYILTNRAYIGEFGFNGIVISLPDLAIISKSIFELAQTRREKNARKASRHRKYDYLLAGGYAHCTCGKRLISRTVYSGGRGKGKRYYYYSCVNHQRRYLYTDCKEKHVRADIADEIVWDWLAGLLMNEDALEAGIRRMGERRDIELAPKRERLDNVNRLIAEYDARIKRVAKRFAEADDDAVADALDVELQMAGKSRTELAEEQAILTAELGQAELTPEDIVKIKTLAVELRGEVENADFAAKRYLIDRLSVRVQLRRDEAGRWLDTTCGFIVNPVSLSIEVSHMSPATTFAPFRNSSATPMSRLRWCTSTS